MIHRGQLSDADVVGFEGFRATAPLLSRADEFGPAAALAIERALATARHDASTTAWWADET